MKAIAIHQPNYLPWPGYFLKMMLCDEFIFLDHVQFSKGSFTNRTTITVDGNSNILSIPLTKVSQKQSIFSKQLAEENWNTNHVNKLRDWLRPLPFVNELDSLFDVFLELRMTLLADVNILILQHIAHLLQIEIHCSRSSARVWRTNKALLINEMLSFYDADTYISGSGFKNYFDPAIWDKSYELKMIDFAAEIELSPILTKDSIVINIAKNGLDCVVEELAQIANHLKKS